MAAHAPKWRVDPRWREPTSPSGVDVGEKDLDLQLINQRHAKADGGNIILIAASVEMPEIAA